MTKKILLIIGILLVIAVALFLILSEETKTGESRVGFSIRDFIPFGNGGDSANLPQDLNINPNDTPIDSAPETSENSPIPKLRKISNEPTAGAIIWNQGTTTFTRFVEKGTGNVFEARSDSLKVTRLTNTTIPKIIRAVWLPDASGFFAQSLIPETEMIETSFVKIKKPTQTNSSEDPDLFETTISKLPTEIKDLIVTKDSKKVLYYTSLSNSKFYIANTDGTNARLILSHPISEWLFRYWISNSSILIQTKRSSAVGSYSFILNIDNGSLTKTQDPLENLKNVLTWSEKCFLPIEKDFVYCATPNNYLSSNFLDEWYRGTLTTDDSIRKIDIENDIHYNTINLSLLSKESTDVVDLQISKDEGHLIFRNKSNGFLYMLRIAD